jgi:hypothetical protein
MKSLSACVLALIVLSLSFPTAVSPQKKTPEPVKPPPLVRTTSKHDVRRFPYGSTLTIVGAPAGSITIEGWSRSELDISADIELRANTEADLDLLATVNNFGIDEDMNHIRILTTGTHDKEFMRLVAKKFPKTLLGLPWKIDYRIRVPQATDLDINAGHGAISIAGVDGNIQLSAAESDAKLQLTGGTLSATIGVGKVNFSIPVKSWRGVGGEVRLATGELTIELAPGFNCDLNADILRSGKITDSFGGLAAREKPGITPQVVKARAGSGGAFFQLTVGDGAIFINKQTADSKQ